MGLPFPDPCTSRRSSRPIPITSGSTAGSCWTNTGVVMSARTRTATRSRRCIASVSAPPEGPLVPSWALTVGVIAAIVAALYVVGKVLPGSSPHARTRPRPRPCITLLTTMSPGRSPPRGQPPPRRPRRRRQRWRPFSSSPPERSRSTPRRRPARHSSRGSSTAPDKQFPTLKSTELLITLGNNGVTMHADGKPYTVKASPAAIGLQVLPTGVSLLAAGKGPVC